MFDLESTAHRLANRLLTNVPFDAVQRAKVEYALALLLGVATELVLTVAVSALLGTALETLIIMLSALSLRLFTGGAHCSSFRRCSVFTVVCFIGLSFPVKATVTNCEFKDLMWVSLLLVILALPFIWKPQRLTLFVWTICASLPIWGMLSDTETAWRILTLPVAAGLVLQSFMLSALGQKVVMRSDKIMQRIGI
ncbi:accessory gene regulator ArgB-like protein [Desulfosporosinus shakirovi]|uniref:accessory gene regulator ArgB-like protein n=1 Tax=Desulfosporosinus shakirovi TaxID=2885154 RepID=UPI001E33B356|nr:accessory gene regulator B family protein [Desulfosporosinus sp. SRJS8]MCB8817577.1 accessory gene regulator B family protein [Desulfosporosinus sp. SRJS8]